LTRKGTRLNGRSVRLTRLRDGDLVELGKVSLIVRMGGVGGGQSLILNGSTEGATRDAGRSAPPTPLAESMGSFAPMRELMDQFQHFFLTRAQMFTTMQQEHSATVYEQLRLMQEMMREFREMRTEGGRNGTALPAPAPAAPTLPPIHPPAPQPVHPLPTQTA